MLVSTLDWIIHIPMILQVRILKSSLFSQAPVSWSWVWQDLCDDSPSGLQIYMNLVLTARTRRQYSLGINWNGHKSGLDKMSCSINFAHFSGVKNHLLFPHISHMSCFLYPWTFLRAKKYLFCELFSSSLPPSSAQKWWSWAVSPQASSDCFMHYW